MAGLRKSEMPAAVATVAETVAEFVGVDLDDPYGLFVTDHTHEELSEGAYSMAHESGWDWAYEFSGAVQAGKASIPRGWNIECGAGWRLHLYPEAALNVVEKFSTIICGWCSMPATLINRDETDGVYCAGCSREHFTDRSGLVKLTPRNVRNYAPYYADKL